VRERGSVCIREREEEEEEERERGREREIGQEGAWSHNDTTTKKKQREIDGP